MAGKAHTVHCSHDWCPEVSTQVPFTPTDPEETAAKHRAWLITEGWSDVEGRMYCQDHTPAVKP